VKAGSLFGFVSGGQTQLQYELDCLGSHRHGALYGARYLAPWLARWISPDTAGAVDGLNLYAYVGNSRVLDCRWLVSW
jgi:RHS repeat-associated protein